MASNVFSVAMSPDEVENLKKFMDSAAKEGEKQSDTLNRIFAIAAKQYDNEFLKESKIDDQALDASLENIRALFLQAARSREEIQNSYVRELEAEREKHRNTEAALQEKITKAEESEKTAVQEKEKALKEAEEAKKECQNAVEAKEAALKEASDKAQIIVMLEETLSDAKQKSESYPALLEELEKKKGEIQELEYSLKQRGSDLESFREAKEAEISLIKTQAELTLANALREAEKQEAEKERLLNQQIREAKETEHKALEELTEVKVRLEEMQKAYDRLQKSYEQLEETLKKQNGAKKSES